MSTYTVSTTSARTTGEPDVANAMDKTWWKVIGGVGTILAGNVAKNALEKSYKGVTGKIPPANPEDPDVEWREALTWAIVSGVVMAIARLLFQRAAAGAYIKRTGELPPGLERDDQVADDSKS
jgi:hypothetical protein